MKELWQSDDGMFKIGITRRLEAFDRVKELVEASVPFPFDIHAMIRTSDVHPQGIIFIITLIESE